MSKWALADPVARSKFEWKMSDFLVDTSAGLDEEVLRWSEAVRIAAQETFPRLNKIPKKSWISQFAWQAVLASHVARKHVRAMRNVSNLLFYTLT